MPARRALAFHFSDQGGLPPDQRTSSLYCFSAAFTAAADTCFAHARPIALEDTAVLRLFALQTALAAMWAAWGVVLTVLAGHNFSEYAALVCAGVLTVALVSVGAALSAP